MILSTLWHYLRLWHICRCFYEQVFGGYAINVTFRLDSRRCIQHNNGIFSVHSNASILTLHKQRKDAQRMSIKSSPTQILNSTHISPFIEFYFSLARLLQTAKLLKMARTKLKLMWNVSINVIILHCVRLSFSAFFFAVVTWRPMIRNDLIHTRISSVNPFICCAVNIFSHYHPSSVYDATYKSSRFFFAWKDSHTCDLEGDCVASPIDICSSRLDYLTLALFVVSLFLEIEATHTHVQIWIF